LKKAGQEKKKNVGQSTESNGQQVGKAQQTYF